MKIIKFKYIIIILFAITAFSCKATTTEPIIKPDTKPIDANPPGSRDYEWKVDTIKTPFSYLSKFWGTSTNDIWLTGSGSLIDYFLWHYNGQKWTQEKQLIENGYISPYSIFGFSKNDLWLCGGGSLTGEIWHGDGTTWKTSLSIKLPGHVYETFINIWGETPGNIYAVGSYDTLINGNHSHCGLIFHYDGSSWRQVNIPVTNATFLKIYKNEDGKDKYYILGNFYNNIGGGEFFKIFELDGSSLKEIHSVELTSSSVPNMIMIKGEIYFHLKSDICRYKNNNFQIIKTIQDLNRGYIIGGRNENDLFFAMPEGLAHYNGTDLQTIFKKPQSSMIMDMLIFGDIVYILASLGEENYIIKGILK